MILQQLYWYSSSTIGAEKRGHVLNVVGDTDVYLTNDMHCGDKAWIVQLDFDFPEMEGKRG